MTLNNGVNSICGDHTHFTDQYQFSRSINCKTISDMLEYCTVKDIYRFDTRKELYQWLAD